jgi:anti-anti-sigma factor
MTNAITHTGTDASMFGASPSGEAGSAGAQGLSRAEEASVFAFDGDFNALFVHENRPLIERIAHEERDVTVDFSRVAFVDSSGLGALVFIHKRLAERRNRLRVVGLQGQPLQLFTNLHLIPVFCGS